MSNIPKIKKGEYKHNKTGKSYTVICVAIDKNNDIQFQVIYIDTANNTVYVREINNFYENFTRVNQDGE